ncbi:hypothetical protein Cgig2_011455 [Carnegiea gigantea]|uniref:DUF4408 domain-containing protein n=1 Tax=Carnegiea gigantea TaxID=171969 RepID=A0A9Q1KSD2_9CARY|nr:hypothetical protein Cgig2_011455 [Carnegiea gigantea]
MFEEAISLLSIWASMNSWLTPAVLFVLLNLMIGTIAVTSGFTSSKPPPQHHHQSDHPQPPQLQPQLTPSPSVLHRLKSLNFYSYIHTPQPIQTHHQSPPSTATTTTAAATVNDPIPEPGPDSSPPPEDAAAEEDEGPTMEEVYTWIIQKQNNPHYGRQNSDTKPAGGEVPIRLPAKMKKSASDKSAFNHFQLVDETETTTETFIEERENAVGNDSEVDARADDFINRFREQLKMQRLESIVRYKEMISRGTANCSPGLLCSVFCYAAPT